MLTSDLLRVTIRDGEIEPRYIDVSKERFQKHALKLLALYREHIGQTRGVLEEAIRELIGDGTDYLIQRGLAKLLADRSNFEVVSSVHPRELREKLFDLSAQNHPIALTPDHHHEVSRQQLIETTAQIFNMSVEQIEAALYADLQDAYIFSTFEDIKTEALLHRYNLALAQGLLFRAEQMQITLHNATAQRLRQITRYIKFFRLMATTRPLEQNTYRIEIDGPISLFRFCQKYGLQMANFLPALLLCEEWQMSARIRWQDNQDPLNFALDHQTNLHSHYPDKGVYLTEEEMHFRKRWGDFKLAWELQPKAEIIRLGLHDTLVTDYLLTHSDGRQIQLAILGYWHRQMLMRKLELLREHAEQPILLAVPSRMHITQQEQTADTERGIYFYKDVIHPKRIAELAEELSCNAT